MNFRIIIIKFTKISIINSWSLFLLISRCWFEGSLLINILTVFLFTSRINPNTICCIFSTFGFLFFKHILPHTHTNYSKQLKIINDLELYFNISKHFLCIRSFLSKTILSLWHKISLIFQQRFSFHSSLLYKYPKKEKKIINFSHC